MGEEKEWESSTGDDSRPLGTTPAHSLAWWVEVCCAFQVRIPAIRSRGFSELVLVAPDLCS